MGGTPSLGRVVKLFEESMLVRQRQITCQAGPRSPEGQQLRESSLSIAEQAVAMLRAVAGYTWEVGLLCPGRDFGLPVSRERLF